MPDKRKKKTRIFNGKKVSQKHFKVNTSDILKISGVVIIVSYHLLPLDPLVVYIIFYYSYIFFKKFYILIGRLGNVFNYCFRKF